MKCRITLITAAALVLLITGFSVGSAAFVTLGLLLIVLLLFALVSVLLAARTLTIEASAGEGRVRRGDDVTLQVRVQYRSLIPVAPILLTMQTMPDEPEQTFRLQDAFGRTQKASLAMHAAHVGVCAPQVKQCEVEDIFGLFTRRWKPDVGSTELLVLPQTFDIEELAFAPGDAGLGTMARATEDISSPSDVRSYQPGDAMKKIHWKLSLRKRDLLVRRFEEPILQDALVLMDCARPAAADEEQYKDLCDTLLETAASVLESQQHADRSIRLPIYGEHPTQLEKGMGMPAILENLARVDFTEVDHFERVLMLEGRNLARIGSVVLITARLNGALVEAITRIHRMGPMVRLYLVTADPDDKNQLRYIGRLQHAAIDVAYVLPMKV